MRQRNDSGYLLSVPDLRRDVGPGEVVDHPELICGFTPVTDQHDAGRPAAAPPAKPSGRQKPTPPTGPAGDIPRGEE